MSRKAKIIFVAIIAFLGGVVLMWEGELPSPMLSIEFEGWQKGIGQEPRAVMRLTNKNKRAIEIAEYSTLYWTNKTGQPTSMVTKVFPVRQTLSPSKSISVQVSPPAEEVEEWFNDFGIHYEPQKLSRYISSQKWHPFVLRDKASETYVVTKGPTINSFKHAQ